jgi:hypothetical protein
MQEGLWKLSNHFFYITIYNNFMNWPIVPFMSPNLGYKILMNMTFMPLSISKMNINYCYESLKHIVLYWIVYLHVKVCFNMSPLQQLYDKTNISFLNYIQLYDSESCFLIHCKEQYVSFTPWPFKQINLSKEESSLLIDFLANYWTYRMSLFCYICYVKIILSGIT